MNVLAPVPEGIAALLSLIRPPIAQEVPVAEAVGLVLAADLRVRAAVPPATLAIRPGYAVRAAETFGASLYSPLPLATPTRELAAGDPLPDGTDAVLPAEAATRLAGGALEVMDGVPAGHWARRVGAELPAGTLLRAAGARLRALDAAVALAAGIATVAAMRPVVGLVGGAEGHVVAAARLLGGMAALRTMDRGDRRDEMDLVLAVDGGATTRSDVPIVGGLALRPGEETRIALIDGVPTVQIAAGLDALIAVGWTLLLPCLVALTGAAPAPSSEPMPLTRKIASTVGVTEIALLRRVPEGLEPLAVADLTLATLARAELWLAVPPASEGFDSGTFVHASPV